jgi:hypothetical protein
MRLWNHSCVWVATAGFRGKSATTCPYLTKFKHILMTICIFDACMIFEDPQTALLLLLNPDPEGIYSSIKMGYI